MLKTEGKLTCTRLSYPKVQMFLTFFLKSFSILLKSLGFRCLWEYPCNSQVWRSLWEKGQQKEGIDHQHVPWPQLLHQMLRPNALALAEDFTEHIKVSRTAFSIFLYSSQFHMFMMFGQMLSVDRIVAEVFCEILIHTFCNK